jgi:hypothetical protein
LGAHHEHMRAIGRLGGLTKASRHSGVDGTAPARAAFRSSFERQVREQDPDLDDVAEIARRAHALRRLFYQRLAFRSAQVRSVKKAANARPTDSRSEGADGSK